MESALEHLRPPAAVLEIAGRLERAGYEVWCVGGAIRDALLGHAHLDWDFATSAKPTEVRAVFGGKSTIPVGIAFGTVGVLDKDGVLHEITTFRRDVRTDGRHAEVEFGVSLEDDLARRDFTINAIAFSPTRGEVRDPFDGRGDLRRRVVRAVGDPDARMREDRLRALRAIRFAARFGFEIDPATRAAIVASAPALGRLSAERVKQEIDKTLRQVARPSPAFRMWRDTGAFAALVPALAEASDEALQVPDYLARPTGPSTSARAVTRLAGLLASMPAPKARETLLALRAAKLETQGVEHLIERLHAIGSQIESALVEGNVPDSQVRRWVAAVGRLNVGMFMRLVSARCSARASAASASSGGLRRLYRKMREAAGRDPLDLGSLAVDGDDLRRIGIPSGPKLGKILHALLEFVIEDPARNTRELLLAQARILSETAGNV